LSDDLRRGNLGLAEVLRQAPGFLAPMQEIAQDPVALGPAILEAHVVVAAQGGVIGEFGPADGAEAHGVLLLC
jgi:hypothetical protein